MSSKGLSRPVLSLFARSPACRPLHRCVVVDPLTRSFSRTLTTTTPYKNEPVVPLRKQLKDEAKQKKLAAKSAPQEKASRDPANEDWELTVGIEIHAELNAACKLFSAAPTSSPSDAPNTNVALFDLAFPGSQPHFQAATLLPAIRAAIALNCAIQRKSTFDRKHYFYQDQPAGYQITQYYEPFAKDGYITLHDYDGIAAEDGESITVGIKQVQMEQDTAKTIQNPPSEHFLDFNRVSHPLIEIITLPQIHHPATAAALVRKIQGILKVVNSCTTGMELGGLRADVNVSVKRKQTGDEYTGSSYHGVTGLGQRTEIKNLSSFKAVEDAIIAERNRQIDVLETGGVIEGETRGWSLGSTETTRLRGKEGEIDYRYMPDPDIPPVRISEELLKHLERTLPMLPDKLLATLTEDPEHSMTMKDAKTLLSFDDGDRVEYYFEVLHHLRDRVGGDVQARLGRLVGNWVIHELGALLGRADTPWDQQSVLPTKLADILALSVQSKISNASAKQILKWVFDGDARSVSDIAENENMLIAEISHDAYQVVAASLIQDNAEMVTAIKEKGQRGKIMWFVGQMMRQMGEKHGKGGVDAERAKKAVLDALNISG